MLVKVNSLKKYYGDKCVVDDVSFEFKSGEIFCLIGRNGSGKTTTIRMILSTLSKDSGSVEIIGLNSNDFLRRVGYLSEERGMFVKDNIIDQLVYFAMLKGVKRNEAFASAEKWLEKLGIIDRKNDKLETLSKGNQQKVQIISCLIHNPDIIVFDEPFSGLDPVNIRWLMDLLVELKEQGKCILLSSHQLNLIEEICDKIGIISYSKLVYLGTLSELKQNKGGTKLYVSFANFVNEEEILKLNYLIKMSDFEYAVELKNEINFKKVISDIMEKKLEINSLQIKELSLNDIFIRWEESKWSQ